MSYSKALANLYDSLMEGYEHILHPTQKLVYEFTQKKEKVDLLELGCGTGSILKAFPDSFSLYGLDLSPEMLTIAKRRVKRAKFFEGDMSNFHIKKRFDVIICVFDSINHLLDFKKWEDTFRLVSTHLKKEGLFIFDMNTQKRHKALINLPAYVKKEKDRIISFKILEAKKNICITRIEVFTNLTEKNVTLFEENILEASFSTIKILRVLKKYFTIEKMVDPFREKVTKDSGRIFFACKKFRE